MKKVILALVVLALLAGVSFFLLKGKGKVDGANFLPADNLLYVSFPDVARTKERWPKTALAQIGAEPAVADFLSKPLDQLSGGGGEASDLFNKVNPHSLFLAVTTLRQTGAHAVLGFKFSGSRKDLDAAMARLYEVIGKNFPNPSTTTADYDGDTVTTFTGARPMIFSAVHGEWGFLSDHEPTLRQTLDRAAGRDKSGSLASAADFQRVLGKLPKEPDFFWYAAPQPLFELILAMGKKQGARVNEKQLQQIEKVRAIGGTLAFDGAEQREATFVLYPDGPKIPPIDRAPMALTTPETRFYYDASLDWTTVASDDYLASLPPEAQAFLARAAIDLKQLPGIFGNDLGLILNWAPSAGIPTAMLALQVKDRARAEAVASAVFTGLGIDATPGDIKGAKVFGIPSFKTPLLDPSLAVGDKFAILSLNTAEIERALSIADGAPTLESAPDFKSALSAYKDAGQAFGYVDSKALFERVYNMARGVIMLAGAFSPNVSKMVDVSKLPGTDDISRHLGPILYTNKQFSDGFLIESSGPITLSQAVMLIAIGAGAGYASQMMGAH